MAGGGWARSDIGRPCPRRLVGRRLGDGEHRLAAVSGRRRKHWGWGYEDQQPTRPSRSARARARPESRGDALGMRARARSRIRWRSSGCGCAAAGARCRPRFERDLRGRRARARVARAGEVLCATSCAGFRGQFEHPPDFVGRPARRDGRRAAAGVVRERARGGDPLRRRAHRSSAASTPRVAGALQRRRLDRPRRPGSRARGGRGLARGADPGGGDRTRPGGAARRARAHAAPLPAVVRVLDARRLDRDARGRALRDACGRTSRTSSSRCGRSRRRASGSRGGCRRRAPASAPTGCSRARRGHSGVITQAWVRVQPRPSQRSSAGVRFERLPRRRRSACARSPSRGCTPSNCRLLDAGRGAH